MKPVTNRQIVSISIDAIQLLYSNDFISKEEYNNIYKKIKNYANKSRYSTEPRENS